MIIFGAVSGRGSVCHQSKSTPNENASGGGGVCKKKLNPLDGFVAKKFLF